MRPILKSLGTEMGRNDIVKESLELRVFAVTKHLPEVFEFQRCNSSKLQLEKMVLKYRKELSHPAYMLSILRSMSRELYLARVHVNAVNALGSGLDSIFQSVVTCRGDHKHCV